VRFAPSAAGEVKVVCRGWGQVRGLRIFVGYVRHNEGPAVGTLAITHGYDGKTFAHDLPMGDLVAAPVTYTVPAGAKNNEFILMEMR
jgi:hypothetical protein